jgi:uncharacterized RDD family membrane protein YckC
VAGGFIDWTICLTVFIGVWLFVIAILALAFELFGAGTKPQQEASTVRVLALSVPVSMGVLVSYFAYFWARGGQTPGMAFTDTRLQASDGGPVGLIRACGRAALAILGAIASAVIVTSSNDQYPEALVNGARGMLGLLLVGHGWMLVDRNRETLQDKLFGVRAVRD